MFPVTHFNIILSSTRRSSEWSFNFPIHSIYPLPAHPLYIILMMAAGSTSETSVSIPEVSHLYTRRLNVSGWRLRCNLYFRWMLLFTTKSCWDIQTVVKHYIVTRTLNSSALYFSDPGCCCVSCGGNGIFVSRRDAFKNVSFDSHAQLFNAYKNVIRHVRDLSMSLLWGWRRCSSGLWRP
jgi:hypothetical protein